MRTEPRAAGEERLRRSSRWRRNDAVSAMNSPSSSSRNLDPGLASSSANSCLRSRVRPSSTSSVPVALNHSAADLIVRFSFEVPARATIFSGSPFGHRQGASAAWSCSSSSSASAGSGNTHGGGSVAVAASAGQAATMRSAPARSAARSRRVCTVSPSRPANTVAPPAPGSKQVPDPGMGSTTSSAASPAPEGSSRTRGRGSASTSRAVSAPPSIPPWMRTSEARPDTASSSRSLTAAGSSRPPSGMIARSRLWPGVNRITSQRRPSTSRTW